MSLQALIIVKLTLLAEDDSPVPFASMITLVGACIPCASSLAPWVARKRTLVVALRRIVVLSAYVAEGVDHYMRRRLVAEASAP